MLKLPLLLAFLAGFLPVCLANSSEAAARQVLEKLVQAAGQFQAKSPKLVLTKENKKVAAYHPARNVIYLDERALEVCRSLGKDSLNALAFILAHELTHSFQSEIRLGKLATNFLAYDKTVSAPVRTEKVADIQGAFTAYLAGFSLQTAVPKLLPKLYEAYDLTGKDLPGYPSFEERKNTAAEVLQITGDLIDLFETANYLAVAKRYDLAAVNYEYVLQYYQGRELHNNLGVTYLLAAMEFFHPATDKFVHSVEIDPSSQLVKIEKSRGGQQLESHQVFVRVRFVEKAIAHFKQAILLDKNYHAAKLNYATALNLLEKPKDALAMLADAKLTKASSKNQALAEKMRLARGIAQALSGNRNAAEAEFSQAAKSSNPVFSVLANFNLNVLRKQANVVLREQNFAFPENFTDLMKTVKLSRTADLEPLRLNADGICLRRKTEGQTQTFAFGNRQGNLVSVVRFKNAHAPNLNLLELSQPLDRAFFYNMVATSNGYYLRSPDNDIVLRVNAKGEVVEMAKLYVH